MSIAEGILALVVVYATIGFAFAVVFAAAGVARFDPAARGSSIWFRMLIIPGCAGLWPLMATKWLRRRKESAP